MKTIKVKQVVKYSGHSVSANGSVNVTFKAMYDELKNSVMLLQLLNNDVKIKARLPGEKPFVLGSFRIKAINVDDDGESVLKFNGLNDYVESNNLNRLVTTENFVVMYEGEVETESEEGEGE